MTGKSFSLAAFRDLLDRHGAVKGRWPADVRADAEALLAADPAARHLFEETHRLERLVSAATAAPPLDAAFVGRVMGRIDGEVAARETAFRFTRRLAFASATALTFCLVAGVAVGLVAPVVPAEDGTDIAVFVLGGADDGETLMGETFGGEML